MSVRLQKEPEPVPSGRTGHEFCVGSAGSSMNRHNHLYTLTVRNTNSAHTQASQSCRSHDTYPRKTHPCSFYPVVHTYACISIHNHSAYRREPSACHTGMFKKFFRAPEVLFWLARTTWQQGQAQHQEAVERKVIGVKNTNHSPQLGAGLQCHLLVREGFFPLSF